MRIGRTAFLVLFAVAAQAADFQISAALDRTDIALNEQVMLSVTVAGAGNQLPQPQMPGLTDFQVANAGRSQNFSWVNGQASASVTFNYVLTPLKTGSFTIPSIAATMNGQTAQTQPLTLNVASGDAAAIPSAPGAPSTRHASPKGPAAIFIKSTVDKKSVYVGEPIQFAFQLYNRVPLFSRPNYQPPQMSGFWSEDLPPQRNYQATVEGMPYNVTELRTALFPTAAGTAKVGSAQLAVTIENMGSDPFSANFFAQFFGRAEEKVLRTDPITVQVKALPDPKPAGFNGAVGRYTMSSNLDKESVAVGQPVTLTISVSGEGNIKSLPALTMPPLTGFRTFDANAATNIEKKDGRVTGSKIYKTVLIPTASGSLVIPPVPFSYFDTAARRYQTLQSKSFTLRVTPGAGGTSSGPSVTGAAGSVSNTPQIQRLAEDIHYIKTPTGIVSQKPFWVHRVGFWLFQIVILLAFLIGAGVRIYQRVFLSVNPRNRFKNAAPRAWSAIADSEKALAKNEMRDAAGHIAQGLHEYLADKLNLNPRTLALKQAQDALRDRGVHSHDTEKVRNLWEMLDLFAFAPTQVRPDDIQQAQRTFRHVIEELEKDVSWKK